MKHAGPLEGVYSVDDFEKSNKRVVEVEFTCNATVYDVYCPPKDKDEPLWKILLGIHAKRKRPTRMPFKSKIRITTNGIKNHSAEEIGNSIKKALADVEQMVEDYSNGKIEIIN